MHLAAELQPDCPAVKRVGRRVAAPRARSGSSLHRSLRHSRQYSCHSREIARQHRRFEVLLDLLDAAIHGLPNSTPPSCSNQKFSSIRLRIT
jgi:hypothetical protein